MRLRLSHGRQRIWVYLEPREPVCSLQMSFSPLPMGALPEFLSWIWGEGKEKRGNGKEGRRTEIIGEKNTPMNFWLRLCLKGKLRGEIFRSHAGCWCCCHSTSAWCHSSYSRLTWRVLHWSDDVSRESPGLWSHRCAHSCLSNGSQRTEPDCSAQLADNVTRVSFLSFPSVVTVDTPRGRSATRLPGQVIA